MNFLGFKIFSYKNDINRLVWKSRSWFYHRSSHAKYENFEPIAITDLKESGNLSVNFVIKWRLNKNFSTEIKKPVLS